jgi:hypothetical protein
VARTRDRQWLAATDQALVGAGLRIPWSDVVHAQWFDEESALVLDPVREAFAPRRFELADPGRLPEVVHERVMASIVVSRRVPVPGGAVRVVGRVDADGELVWQVVPEVGVDLDRPEVRRAADHTVADLRREFGQ